MTQALTPNTLRPEDLDEFRQARLLLLLRGLASLDAPAPDLERLSFYDFFSANPFLVPVAEETRVALSSAGFDAANLSYQSSSQRFANNRARLQFDLAMLLARNLVRLSVQGRRVTYGATDAGVRVAESLRSMYARSYTESVRRMVGRLRRLSDTALRTSARQWLRAEDLMIDLYEPDVTAP